MKRKIPSWSSYDRQVVSRSALENALISRKRETLVGATSLLLLGADVIHWYFTGESILERFGAHKVGVVFIYVNTLVLGCGLSIREYSDNTKRYVKPFQKQNPSEELPTVGWFQRKTYND